MTMAVAAANPPAMETPPVETLSVKVNGRPLEVPKLSSDWSGKPVPTTMIQACEMAGVTVPHYCYHPRLPVAGNCRMCLVEYGTPTLGPDRQPVRKADGSFVIQKSPRPAIACATALSPGMEIYTDTATVRAMREGVLEFLLINHPLDCPICDQAGECKLQEYSIDYGKSASRFVETKVHKPKQVDLGPRIMLDDERCILCTRCIRFTKDIVGDDALGIINRGGYNTLTAYPGRKFDNNYTLNTVDICPVGALTSKDFRFQMRVWFLKETLSLCTSCGTGCNIHIGSRENRVYRYTPRENAAVNKSWMCDAGRLNYRWINRPDRWTDVRVAGQRSTWTAAVAEVAARLQRTPAGHAAIVVSSRQTNEELYLVRRLAQRIGAVTDTVPRQGPGDRLLVSPDKNPNSTAARLMGLAANPPGSNLARLADRIRDGSVTTLLVIGEDPLKWGLDETTLRRLNTLVVSDILPNGASEIAHVVLPGCAHAEKRGTFTNVGGQVQRFLKAVEPPGDARPETEWLGELLEQVTGERIAGSLEGLFNQMAADVPAFHGLTWARLGDTGLPVPTGSP